MIQLASIQLMHEVPDPGANASHHTDDKRIVFTNDDYHLTLADFYVEVEHVETGKTLIVPLHNVRYARKVYVP